jgi:membrane peptidoglycan carboxypeptidase
MKDFPAAGKTGTHAEFKDLWFMGYTSTVTCGVWVGFDKQKTIYDGAFSSRIALPIWTDTMNVIGNLYPAEELSPPPSAERVELCKNSGMRATDFCFDQIPQPNGKMQAVRTTYLEYLRPGTRFENYCTTHSAEGISADILMFKPASSSSGSGGSLADTGKFIHIEPVRMQGLTILGEDPYKAYQPVRRAIPVEEEGVEVKRAELVEGQEDEEPTIPIRLAPPPRVSSRRINPNSDPATSSHNASLKPDSLRQIMRSGFHGDHRLCRAFIPLWPPLSSPSSPSLFSPCSSW